MKATNTEHTAINGNQSKCRMTQFNLGGALTKSGVRRTSLQESSFHGMISSFHAVFGFEATG